MKGDKIVKAAKELPLEATAEAFIDALVSNDSFRDIPVVGGVLGVFKAYKTYKNESFKARLKEFLDEAGGLSKDEIEYFLVEGASSENPVLVEHLIELVERADSEQKAKIIGVLFRRLVKGKISRSEFFDQVRFTNQIYLMDIFFFMHGYHNQAVLQDGLGDLLANHRICKRTVELAYRDQNLLKMEKEQYINVKFEITGVGRGFLLSLHEAYRDKIKEHLLTD
ncbi:hypothetical protein AB1462_16215 [Pseudomonas sp. SB113]|uniref:hypothetical protein n=1 Tax=Pseudomonas sp. SB113 TaxID=3154123 RepID=UPI00345D71FC